MMMGVAMPIELSQEECRLVIRLLEDELEDVRVEVNHTENFEYKAQLLEREKSVRNMLKKFEASMNSE